MPATSPRNPVPGPKQGADARRMAARLERAVDTLARLPRDSGTLPAGVRSAWPEMIRGKPVPGQPDTPRVSGLPGTGGD